MDLKDYLIIFMLIAVIIRIGGKYKDKFIGGVTNNISNNPSINNYRMNRSYNGNINEDMIDESNNDKTIFTYIYSDGVREVITRFNDGRESKRITRSDGTIILDEEYIPPQLTATSKGGLSNNVSNNLNNLTAFIATGNGNTLDLNGNVNIASNLTVNGNTIFNSNVTKFKGAGTTTGLDTHFPYVAPDGSNKGNYISGPTFFRDGNVSFAGSLSGNSLLTGYPTYNVNGLNIDVPVGFNSTTFFKGANGAGPTHFPYVDANGNFKNNYISGPTIFRQGNVIFNDTITATKGFKTSYGSNEKITWNHNSDPSISQKIDMGTVSDGTYLVIATSDRDFNCITSFSKKGNIIKSSPKDNLVVESESTGVAPKIVNNMWVKCTHPNQTNITVMFIKLSDITF